MTSLCRDCLSLTQAMRTRCACGSRRIVDHPELRRLPIAHLDCDAFYASVEKRDRPELRDLPVIVGGGVRGVVTTACYIARMSGVRSAMPMFQARRLCPQAVIVKPDFRKYVAESRRIMAKLRMLTPLVQPLSLDEAWLDLTGTARLHGAPPALTLARLQAEIEREIGLTVSVGLAANKYLAKIASDLDKPRGFAVIGEAEARAFLAPRPVGLLPGVGPAFAKTLTADGFSLIGDLARADPRRLADRYGAMGLRLHQLAHGKDGRAVEPHARRKSLSSEMTFERDIRDRTELEDVLWRLCDKVAARARAEAIAGRVAVLKLRSADFRTSTRRRTFPVAVQTAKSFFAVARELLAQEAPGRPYRLIGVGLTQLVSGSEAEADFLAGESRALKAELAADTLRQRFGPRAVMGGRDLRS